MEMTLEDYVTRKQTNIHTYLIKARYSHYILIETLFLISQGLAPYKRSMSTHLFFIAIVGSIGQSDLMKHSLLKQCFTKISSY